MALSDNMEGQCRLITGFSGAPDMSVTTTASHTASSWMGISVWFGHLTSESNRASIGAFVYNRAAQCRPLASSSTALDVWVAMAGLTLHFKAWYLGML